MNKTTEEVIEIINNAISTVEVSYDGSIAIKAKGFPRVKVDKNHPINNDGYGVQGESNTTTAIFELVPEDNLFLRVESCTDSYGNEATLSNIRIVRGKEKTVKIFEYE